MPAGLLNRKPAGFFVWRDKMRRKKNNDQLSLELFLAPEAAEEIDPNPEPKVTGQPRKDSSIDRNKVFDTYRSLGQTVRLEGDRGLPDMHRRRAANFQQFFTPYPAVRFITEAMALDLSKSLIVLDNACGIGGMFRYLPASTRIKGIELERSAYKTAAKLFPEANIINDSLIHHITDLEDRADVALINPPFSIQIEKEGLPLENAQWGVLGPKSSIQSHIAAVEIAIRSARFVAAVLPDGLFRNESARTVSRWIGENASLLLSVRLPGKLFRESGCEWPCTIAIWDTKSQISEPVRDAITRWDDLERVLGEWKLTDAYGMVRDWVLRKAANPSPNFTLQVWNKPKRKGERRHFRVTPTDEVKVCLSPNASSLVLKPNGLLAALKVQEYKDEFGETYNQATKRYVKLWDRESRASEIIESGRAEKVEKELDALGIRTAVDPQLQNWSVKKRRWLKRQRTPFEQWIKKDGEWNELHQQDGIRASYPELYRQQTKRLEKLGIDWLWDFQKDDV